MVRASRPGEQFQSVLANISCGDVFDRRSAIEQIALSCRSSPGSRCPQALSALSKQLTDEAHRALAACAASALGGVLALNADGRRRPAAGAAGSAHEPTDEEDAALSALVRALQHGYDGVRVAAACALGKACLRHKPATAALLKIVEHDGSWQARRAAVGGLPSVCTFDDAAAVSATLNRILASQSEPYDEVRHTCGQRAAWHARVWRVCGISTTVAHKVRKSCHMQAR